MDTTAHARDLLAGNRYAVLASADADGSPWATPVWFAHDGLDRIAWISWPGSRHSELIAARPEIALTVSDSSLPSSEAAALYATASARQCPEEDLDVIIALLDQRSQEQGLGSFGRADLTGSARLWPYVATILDAWVLDQDAPVDRRAPVVG